MARATRRFRFAVVGWHTLAWVRGPTAPKKVIHSDLRPFPSLPEALRSRLRPVCVAVAAPEPEKLFRNATAALGESTFLELRFDAMPNPREGIAALRVFCARHSEATVLATCRRVAGGGGFGGSAEEQLELLALLAHAGAGLVDLELEALEEASPTRLRAFGEELARAGTVLVVSAHDFAGTGDLHGVLGKLQALGRPAGACVYKVVSAATALADNLRMLRFVGQAASAVPVVGMCMGAAGVPSRILALRAGAVWTFGAAGEGLGTAPGQVAAVTLRELYRIETISPATRVYGVAGNPVAHSLSPAIHNAGFRTAGVDAVYLPLHTTSVRDLITLVRELPLAGLSVTMPWKVEIVPLLDEVDPLARKIGAVNTVTRREDGSLWGTNTDAAATVEPLEQRIALRGTPVLLMGAGGAARAAAFGLCAAGAEVAILNRTPEAAEQLARDSGAQVADPGSLDAFEVVVNATPAGMAGPFAEVLPVDLNAIPGARVVFDMVYRPAETPLVRAARARSIEVITGVEMFLHQGARQWSLWTGQDAPMAAIRAALEAALGDEQREEHGDGKV